MAFLWHQAEAEDLASKHARELQHLKDSLEEALQALTCAQDEQATAEVHYSGQARMLEQQHEHLTQKLQAQHTHDMQVRPLAQAGVWKGKGRISCSLVLHCSSQQGLRSVNLCMMLICQAECCQAAIATGPDRLLKITGQIAPYWLPVMRNVFRCEPCSCGISGGACPVSRHAR